MSSKLRCQGFQGAQLHQLVSVMNTQGKVRTDSCQHDDVAILPFAHCWQHGFDDIDVREEICLKSVLDQIDRSTTLRKLFYSADDSLQ